MPRKKTLTFKIEGGNAKPAPPIAPAISDLGLNVEEAVNRINKATELFKGMEITVKVIVDTETREYEIEVEPPSTTTLLLRAVGAEKPSGDPAHVKIGDLPFEKIVEIALMKKPHILAKTLKSAVKMILGSARSIGITVEGKDPKEVTREIDQGVYDAILAKYEEKWREKV